MQRPWPCRRLPGLRSRHPMCLSHGKKWCFARASFEKWIWKLTFFLNKCNLVLSFAILSVIMLLYLFLLDKYISEWCLCNFGLYTYRDTFLKFYPRSHCFLLSQEKKKNQMVYLKVHSVLLENCTECWSFIPLLYKTS